VALRIGRETCRNLESALTREWLVTNGLGGFASGTVAGVNTRRYHGLLVAAMNPPVQRMVLLAALEEWLLPSAGEAVPLAAHEYWDGTVYPEGFVHLDGLELDGMLPVFRWTAAGRTIEKRIWMEHETNRSVISYRLVTGPAVTLQLRPLFAHRDYHQQRHGQGGFDMAETPIPAKKLIGYLPENAPSYTDMTVYGFLGFCAELRGLHGEHRKQAVHRAVEMCFLEPVIHQSVDTLSKGYRHRTCLAQSILHDPDVLILDEPTDGLDPNQKHEARQLIRRMGEKKVIIFSTHILEEVEAVCTRAIIIDRGKIVANGTPAQLKQRSEVAGAVSLRVIGVAADTIKARLSSVPGARKAAIVKEEAGAVWARAYPTEGSTNGTLARSVAEAGVQAGWKFEELHTEEGRLDEVFRSITWSETAKKEDAQ